MTSPFDTVISRLGTHAEKYESRKSLFGKADVDPFWVADMDLPTPQFLMNAMARRMEHPMYGYTTIPSSLTDAIQWWMREQHACNVEKNWLRLSPSVVTSIAMGILSNSEKGDSVVVCSPVYGPFFFVPNHNRRKVIDIPLLQENEQYTLNFEAIESCFAAQRPKLLLLSNPHNPGGRVWTQAELNRLADLCATYDVCIFSDEIHCDVVYEPHQHFSMLNIEAAKERLIVAHSIGKTFNTSGLNASFVVIPNKKRRDAFAEAQECSHCGAVNIFGKVALESAFSKDGAEYKRALCSYLNENRQLALEKLRRIPNAFIMEPQATFLVWCDFRAHGAWSDVMKKLIHQANIALSGGSFFGPAGEGWFRLNIAHPKANLQKAVDRMVDTLCSP